MKNRGNIARSLISIVLATTVVSILILFFRAMTLAEEATNQGARNRILNCYQIAMMGGQHELCDGLDFAGMKAVPEPGEVNGNAAKAPTVHREIHPRGPVRR